MNWWWVNHGQTRDQEVHGSYLWSPKQNKNESHNLTYDYMSEARSGDIIFSFAKSQIGAVGVVLANATTAAKPKEFGSTGGNWASSGWFLKVKFIEAPIRIRPKSHIESIREYLPVKYSPIRRKTGDGNQRFYLTSISGDLGLRLLDMIGIGRVDALVELTKAVVAESHATEEELRIQDEQDLRPTVKKQLVEARRGQGIFRSRVWAIESYCRVTNVRKIEHLRASHIKPWSVATNRERLDGCNGLLLAPHVDHLFDQGFISFEDSGELIISKQLSAEVREAWNIQSSAKLQPLNMKQRKYMDYHRKNIFLDTKKKRRLTG